MTENVARLPSLQVAALAATAATQDIDTMPGIISD
jgi:hypothetical protein